MNTLKVASCALLATCVERSYSSFGMWGAVLAATLLALSIAAYEWNRK